jgi:hypothetical protein
MFTYLLEYDCVRPARTAVDRAAHVHTRILIEDVRFVWDLLAATPVDGYAVKLIYRTHGVTNQSSGTPSVS